LQRLTRRLYVSPPYDFLSQLYSTGKKETREMPPAQCTANPFFPLVDYVFEFAKIYALKQKLLLILF